MFVVGIDGGGTKTRVAVCASDGTLLHRETLGVSTFPPSARTASAAVWGDPHALRRYARTRRCASNGGAGVSGAAMGKYRAELAAHGFAGKPSSAATMRSRSQAQRRRRGVLIAGTGSTQSWQKRRRRAFFAAAAAGTSSTIPAVATRSGRDALCRSAPDRPRTAVFRDCAPRRGDGHRRRQRHSGHI